MRAKRFDDILQKKVLDSSRSFIDFVRKIIFNFIDKIRNKCYTVSKILETIEGGGNDA